MAEIVPSIKNPRLEDMDGIIWNVNDNRTKLK